MLTTTNDWLGRVLSTSYPGDEVVSYTYNSLGQPKSLESSAMPGTTLVDLAYNMLGQITSAHLGNEATISNTYNTQLRLDSRNAVDGSSNSLMDFDYSYDNTGNITQIVDNTLGETLTYTYDSLSRLLTADAAASGTYRYRQAFTYDKINNILQVSSYNLMGWMPSQYPMAMVESNDSSPSKPNRLAQLPEDPTATPTTTETATSTAT
ncbi:hypothetical protein EG834_16685, partial [bacterium]|nr:hypothetical protein [bacterium]